MHTRRVIAIAGLLLGFVTLSAGSASDQIRDFADSMAQLILDDDTEKVYEAMAPSLRSAYSREQLTAPLRLSRQMHGKLLSYEFRVASFGARWVFGQRIKFVQYTYAVPTSLNRKGHFLNVEVTLEGGRYYLAGYSVVQFLGTDEPPFLRSKKAQ